MKTLCFVFFGARLVLECFTELVLECFMMQYIFLNSDDYCLCCSMSPTLHLTEFLHGNNT